MEKKLKDKDPRITKLYGIREEDGMYHVVTVKADLDNLKIIDSHSEEAMNLESARVQFKVHVVRNVIEGNLD